MAAVSPNTAGHRSRAPLACALPNWGSKQKQMGRGRARGPGGRGRGGQGSQLCSLRSQGRASTGLVKITDPASRDYTFFNGRCLLCICHQVRAMAIGGTA